MRNVQLYTDGSCNNNVNGKGEGGIAYLLYFTDNKQTQTASKGYYFSSSNRMELLAVIEALASLGNKKHHVQLTTDSQFVELGIQKLQNQEMPKSEQDLWQQLKPFLQQHQIHCVRKSTHPKLDECHRLANQARKQPLHYDIALNQAVNLSQYIEKLEKQKRHLTAQLAEVEASITILRASLDILCRYNK